jgi:hypothetical protein
MIVSIKLRVTVTVVCVWIWCASKYVGVGNGGVCDEGYDMI